MKYLLLLAAFVINNDVTAQQTYVPNDNFEAYIEAVIPLADNGIANDDSVLTIGLTSYTGVVNPQVITYYITDFTGIEMFSKCSGIDLLSMPMTSLNLSALNNSSLDFIKVNSCGALTDIFLPAIPMSADLEFIFNSNLTNLDFPPGLAISDSSSLKVLWNWSLQEIDLSSITVDEPLAIEVRGDSILETLNLANGGCNQYDTVTIADNPLLFCVEVDDPVYSDLSPQWFWQELDAYQAGLPGFPGPYGYTTTGNCGSVYLEELGKKSNVELIKVTDLMGRETDQRSNTPLLYIYSDGSVNRVFEIEYY